MKLLVINCGSTSMKLGIFEDETQIAGSSLPLHRARTLEEGLDERRRIVEDFLLRSGAAMEQFDCIVARGGCFYPVEGGAYELDEGLAGDLKATLKNNVGNFSGILAYQLARQAGIPAYIYDAVCVDELMPVARCSGVKGVPRYSRTHTLNTRAVAREAAAERGRDYRQMNIVTAHLGGGCSVNIFAKGRIVDLVTSEEGSFSAERCGGLPGDLVLEIARAQGLEELERLFHGTGGLVSYFGTPDAQEVLRRIDAGDREAALIFEAMAYQISKSICSMAAAVDGQVDLIVLTGGMMRARQLPEWISRRVGFLAPVAVKPGEHEMSALAAGALAVLRGKETAKRYQPHTLRACT